MESLEINCTSPTLTPAVSNVHQSSSLGHNTLPTLIDCSASFLNVSVNDPPRCHSIPSTDVAKPIAVASSADAPVYHIIHRLSSSLAKYLTTGELTPRASNASPDPVPNTSDADDDDAEDATDDATATAILLPRLPRITVARIIHDDDDDCVCPIDVVIDVIIIVDDDDIDDACAVNAITRVSVTITNECPTHRVDVCTPRNAPPITHHPSPIVTHRHPSSPIVLGIHVHEYVRY